MVKLGSEKKKGEITTKFFKSASKCKFKKVNKFRSENSASKFNKFQKLKKMRYKFSPHNTSQFLIGTQARAENDDQKEDDEFSIASGTLLDKFSWSPAKSSETNSDSTNIEDLLYIE